MRNDFLKEGRRSGPVIALARSFLMNRLAVVVAPRPRARGVYPIPLERGRGLEGPPPLIRSVVDLLRRF